MAKHEEYLWKDPFEPSLSGAVLLSDQIHFLADEIGLIDPFDEKFLRPAAYDMRIGNSYYVNDVRRDLTDEAIEIPANGLVYIRTKEKFNIPYYLVARYSLRVHQVYRGLLIDNGLHIDPGYCGYIWIPVHNFTTQPRILPQGQEFISVEFNRTTRLPAYVEGIKSQDELVALGLRNELKGSKGRSIKVFYKDLERYRKRNEEFTPRLFWDKFLGEKHESAMLGTERRLDKVQAEVEATVRSFEHKLERRLDTLRNVGFLAVAGVIVGILAILLPILYAEYGKSREVAAEHSAEIRELRERLVEQKNRLDAATPRQLTPNPAPPNPPSAPTQTQRGGR
jgi:deoxycytidine triphosphate deaminase